MTGQAYDAPLFGDLLAGLGTWVLVASAAWGALLGAATVVETVTGGRVRATSWVGCPERLRRLLLAALGLTLAGTGPAGAGGAPVQDARAGGAADLPVPARTVGPGASTAQASASVVVGPGDTLWHLTAARLRPGARASQVVLNLARLHRANRGVIGPDPDLIHPGQRLTLPRRLAAAAAAAPRHQEETP